METVIWVTRWLASLGVQPHFFFWPFAAKTIEHVCVFKNPRDLGKTQQAHQGHNLGAHVQVVTLRTRIVGGSTGMIGQGLNWGVGL